MLNGFLRRTLARLRHPTFGVACALLAAALCATGGVLFKLVPQFYRFRLWHAWSAPRWHTVWVYVLLAVVVGWCLHAVLHLHHSVKRPPSPQTKSRTRRFVAAVQLVLVLAIGADVWFVVQSPPEQFVVTTQGVQIHDEFYRALRIEPGDRAITPARPTVVWLERRAGQVNDQLRVSRGSFWTATNGAHQLVVVRAYTTSDGAVLRHGDRQVALSAAKPLKEGKETFLLRRLRHRGREHSNQSVRADVQIGNRETALPLDPEWAGENALLGLKESPVFLLRVRRNLVMHLAFIASALFLGAMLFFWHTRGIARSSQ